MLLTTREEDRFIMQVALDKAFSEKERISINRCRCRLKAVSFADISTGDGRYISEEAYECRGANPGKQYVFPKEEPSREDIRTWKKFLEGEMVYGRKLEKPLGLWLQEPTDAWIWYWCASTGDLFSRNITAGWWRFTPVHTHHTRREREFQYVEA